MSAHAEVLENLEKLFPNDRKLAVKIANSVINVLDEGGWLTTDDDHLALLRQMKRRIAKAVAAEETPARDLASLTRRLQDISREVSTLEEKERQEKKGSKGDKSDSSGRTPAGDTPFDGSQL